MDEFEWCVPQNSICNCSMSFIHYWWGKPQRAMLIDVVRVILVVIKSKHKLCFDEIKIRHKYLVKRRQDLVLTWNSSYVWLRCWWLSQVFGRWQVSELLESLDSVLLWISQQTFEILLFRRINVKNYLSNFF